MPPLVGAEDDDSELEVVTVVRVDGLLVVVVVEEADEIKQTLYILLSAPHFVNQ